MDKHGSEKPPNFAMPNFQQASEPLTEPSLHNTLWNEQPQNRFLVVTKARHQRGCHADANKDRGQITHSQSVESEKFAAVVESFLRGLIGLLFLPPFFLGDA